MKICRAALLNAVIGLLVTCLLSGKVQTAWSLNNNDLLTYSELSSLYVGDDISPALSQRLTRLLTIPFVENGLAPSPPRLASSTALGEYIRVATWNIERGLEYEALEAAFRGDDRLLEVIDQKQFPEGSAGRARVLDQARMLRQSDVIILNEVDWGLKRSGYRNIAAELAKKLGFNHAFGVEFVELTPVSLNDSKGFAAAPELTKIDSAQYKGLHGTAILSRFPLENVRLIPFKYQPYDWYNGEKNSISLIEKARRKLVKEVFLEEAMREVRRGGRMMLIADITDSRFPGGRATIVATHTEIRTSPDKRRLQLKELLETIKPIRNPVIVAGDMNTSGQDMTPTTLQRELSKRFGKPEYWLKTGINSLLGLGLFDDAAAATFTFGRNHGDPTVRHIPILMPNEERKFFSILKEFRFADGGAFDFRGESARSSNGKKNTLANSNERDGKGFVTTFRLNRPVKFFGTFKLDWLFIKPVHLFDPSNYQGSYLFAPHFGRTLDAIPAIVENRISDHSPMIVDLPVGEPSIPKQSKK